MERENERKKAKNERKKKKERNVIVSRLSFCHTIIARERLKTSRKVKYIGVKM